MYMNKALICLAVLLLPSLAAAEISPETKKEPVWRELYLDTMNTPETPLMRAAHQDAAACESLLRAGAEVDARDKAGRTALYSYRQNSAIPKNMTMSR